MCMYLPLIVTDLQNFVLGAVPVYNAYYGHGAGPVVINLITCTSSAKNISQCTITKPSSCSHNDDAGVICAGYNHTY